LFITRFVGASFRKRVAPEKRNNISLVAPLSSHASFYLLFVSHGLGGGEIRGNE